MKAKQEAKIPRHADMEEDRVAEIHNDLRECADSFIPAISPTGKRKLEVRYLRNSKFLILLTRLLAASPCKGRNYPQDSNTPKIR